MASGSPAACGTARSRCPGAQSRRSLSFGSSVCGQAELRGDVFLLSSPRGIVWVSGRVSLESPAGFWLPSWASGAPLARTPADGLSLASSQRGGRVSRSEHPKECQ